MKNVFKLKKESLIMIFVLSFYGFVAGGSADVLMDEVFWIIVGLILLVIVVLGCFIVYIENLNKKKRLELKKEFESNEIEINLSDKIGNDRIGLYFDKDKEKVLLVSITTDGINKYYVDNFVKDVCRHDSVSYFAIDDNRRKALLVQYEDGLLKYDVKEYGFTDNNKEAVINNSIPTQFYFEHLPQKVKNDILIPPTPTFIVLEEKYGHIAFFNNLSMNSFNYIKENYIPMKKGNTSFITKKKIGSYIFLMDEAFKVLIIISPLISSQKVLNYSDIINVTYEEDGNTLFSKSMKRTVGGAFVGGTLMGGAGAIVGGLSGDTSQIKEVNSMSIKILVRDTAAPTVSLPINLNGESFNTKDEKSKNVYKARIRTANAIKDLISVIIDNSNQQISMPQKIEEPKAKASIADELVKLAQLKDSGILSEEEFIEQKKKLLN